MSIHAERMPAVRHPGSRRLPARIAALASIAAVAVLTSTAVLVLALIGTFDGAADRGLRGAMWSDELAAGATTRPAGTRIGVRGVPLPAVARIGVRGVPLPAVTRSGARGLPLPPATRIGVRGVPLPPAQPGGRANPAP